MALHMTGKWMLNIYCIRCSTVMADDLGVFFTRDEVVLVLFVIHGNRLL